MEMFDRAELGSKTGQLSFSLSGTKQPDSGILRPPDQTNSKSKLVAEYIRLFQQITRGGLYIDGFAAPQSRDHEESWTARRVLEVEPKRLRAFWLCDVDPEGITQLNKLKAAHHRNPKSRYVYIQHGDFNQLIHGILKTPKMRRNTAVFALLDQRTAECHWSTVEAIAARAGRTKIEILYFLGTSWLHRSLSQSRTPERLAQLNLWWGSDGWRSLIEKSQVRMVEAVGKRFTDELKYRYVKPYPIFQMEDGNRVSFYLIHASDHPEAQKLMDRAFVKVVGDVPGVDAGRQKAFSFEPPPDIGQAQASG